jgi:6-phosphogluconolactonase
VSERTPEIVVEAGPEQLAKNTAARVVATLVTALGTRPYAHLVLTGGGILEQLMSAIGQSPARESVDWGRVHIWWADERFVPAESDDRNDKAAFRLLLGALPLNPAHVHPMPASDAGFAEPEAAAQAYADELAAAVSAEHAAAGEDLPHFDLVLLGVGPDGHCASLFPEHPGVYEEQASVIAVRNSPKPPPTRLSFTFRALDTANEVWFVASGAGKARAVAMAFSGAGRVQVPAAGPRGRQRTLWLIDHEAAADLPRNLYQPPVA